MSSQQANCSDLSKRLALLEAENKELKQRLEQVEKDRIQYLQNVSHQLVAPLNAIKWHIENLTEARIGIERAQKVLRSIYSQATLAVHLAKNFNLMSNLETEHALSTLKEPLQDVELCRLLVNLADDFQPLAWERDIQIEVVKHPFNSAPPVFAIKPLVSQVFSNIIENAVKYSNNNTRIEIHGSYLNKRETVTVKICNRGIGIQAKHLNAIFDRGFRSPEALCKYPAGTGFGLYIARKIVEIHQGNITAEMDGDLTIFSVTLHVSALRGKARHRE